MAIRTCLLGIPGVEACINLDLMVEAHYFPAGTDDDGESKPSTLVMTMATTQSTKVIGERETAYMVEPLTLRFRGDKADRMWDAIKRDVYTC